MGRYLLRRTAFAIVVVMGAATITFMALYLVADPVRTLLPPGTPTANIERMETALGMNRPLWEQYATFMVRGVQGDFGVSLWLGESALGVVVGALGRSAILAVSAVFVGVAIGTSLGLIAALRPQGWADRIVTFASFVSLSTPAFVVGVVLVVLFAVRWDLFPTAGYGTWNHLVLPVLTLSLIPLGRSAQVSRSAMIQERTQPYAIAAAANGYSPLEVAIYHQAINVAPQVVTMSLFDVAYLIVGAGVVVEALFAWPGIGRLVVGALGRGDVFVVQAAVVVGAIVVAGVNLLADVISVSIDPRVRTREFAASAQGRMG